MIRIRCAALLCLLLSLLCGCEKALDLDKPASEPLAVFEDLWNVMDRQYALFPVKAVNWADTHELYSSLVRKNMNDGELFRVLGDMLETLHDGHVALISGSGKDVYDNFYKAFPSNFNYDNLLKNYLHNDYKTAGPVMFRIVDSIGYLYYDSFEKNISPEQLDNLFAEMIPKTKGLIVDVRNNKGGKSVNADMLFSRFISERKLVKYEMRKKGPGHDEFSDPEAFYLSPAGQVYGKRVAVLTNRSCFSACNDFVLYMSGLQNVKLVGDQTGGGGGIPHDYILVNGWKVQYTATVTLSPDKMSIENGIQPDIAINISPIDEANGKDPILERAFLLLK